MGSTLVSVVVPSDAGGAIGSLDAVEGEPGPLLEVPVAIADELVALRLGDESEPEMSCGPALFAGGAEIGDKVVGALALTTNVGAADSVVGSGAVVTTVGAELATSVVVVDATVAVLVVETAVVCAGSVTVVTCGAISAALGADWMFVAVEGELISAACGPLICAAAGAGAGLGVGALGVADPWAAVEVCCASVAALDAGCGALAAACWLSGPLGAGC